MNKGYVHIYTGNGKGKTTASIGLVVRARGFNMNVCYICFHKNVEQWKNNEIKIFNQLKIDNFSFASVHPGFDKIYDNTLIRNQCLDALVFIKKLFKENNYDLIILDEIIISLRDNFLTAKELIELIDCKPASTELVLTGSGATASVIEKADLVTEMKEIKHYFKNNVFAREGIEY